MKEKQFIITDDGQFRDTVFGYVFDKKSACDLLNEAYEWAGQDSELIKTLRKSVHELRIQVNSQKNVIKGYQERCDNVFDENQRIINTIKDTYSHQRTDMGKSVLRQLCANLEIEV